jgi:hypothetical protein
VDSEQEWPTRFIIAKATRRAQLAAADAQDICRVSVDARRRSAALRADTKSLRNRTGSLYERIRRAAVTTA